MLVCQFCDEKLGWATAYCPYCGKPRPAIILVEPTSEPKPKPESEREPERKQASGEGRQQPPQPRPVSAALPGAAILAKGHNVSLESRTRNLHRVVIELGWRRRTGSADDVELDAAIFMTGADSKVRDDADLVFYNQLESACRSVVLTEHTKQRARFAVDLDKVPSDIQGLMATLTVCDESERGYSLPQCFGGVYVRIIHPDTHAELARFNLPGDNGAETAMILCAVYRRNGDWKFKAVGQGFSGGLKALCGQYGVSVA